MLGCLALRRGLQGHKLLLNNEREIAHADICQLQTFTSACGERSWPAHGGHESETRNSACCGDAAGQPRASNSDWRACPNRVSQQQGASVSFGQRLCCICTQPEGNGRSIMLPSRCAEKVSVVRTSHQCKKGHTECRTTISSKRLRG